MLFAAVTLFALSTVTRSVLASYAGSVLIYVLYFVASALTNSPLMASSVPGADESAWLAALLDPFALSAFFEQTRNWTPALRNTKLISLTGNFLLNRLLWIGVVDGDPGGRLSAVLVPGDRRSGFGSAAARSCRFTRSVADKSGTRAATALQTIETHPIGPLISPPRRSRSARFC